MIYAKQAAPHEKLISELMDSRVPKTESEHAAAREIEKLRSAIAEASEQGVQQEMEQEPVAWQHRTRPNWKDESCWTLWEDCSKAQAQDCWNRPQVHDWLYEARALYTHPPRREWVGLTDEEIWEISQKNGDEYEYYRAIEAKLKEKNT